MTTHIIPSGRVPVDPYRPNIPDFDLLPSEEQKRLRDLEKVKYLAATYGGDPDWIVEWIPGPPPSSRLEALIDKHESLQHAKHMAKLEALVNKNEVASPDFVVSPPVYVGDWKVASFPLASDQPLAYNDPDHDPDHDHGLPHDLGYIDSSPSPTYFPPKWKVEELKSEAERSAAPECDFFNYDALYYPTVTWAPVVFDENQNVWTVVDLAFDSTKNEMLTSQIFVNQQELADIEKSIIPECDCRTCRGACDCDECINALEDTEMPDMALSAPPAQTSEIVFDVEALMSKNYDVITREETNQRWPCGHKRDDSSYCPVCAIFGRRVED